jgi:hypothetical protein
MKIFTIGCVTQSKKEDWFKKHNKCNIFNVTDYIRNFYLSNTNNSSNKNRLKTELETKINEFDNYIIDSGEARLSGGETKYYNATNFDMYSKCIDELKSKNNYFIVFYENPINVLDAIKRNSDQNLLINLMDNVGVNDKNWLGMPLFKIFKIVEKNDIPTSDLLVILI